jgi:hypothetical protein
LFHKFPFYRLSDPPHFFLPIHQKMFHRFLEDSWKEKAMGPKRWLRKRPCRICGKWFIPNPRLGERQKTCGADECQQRWHAKKCAVWNRRNRSYFKEIYLRRRLESCSGGSPCPSPSPGSTSRTGGSSSPPSVFPLDLPQEVIQEVMCGQHAVIIGYILRQLMRGVQEVINAQHADIYRGFMRLPLSSVSRGDSQRSP